MANRPQILNHLLVVDLGVGMASALISKFLIELGARVVRVEPPEGDPFGAIYPAYHVWRRGAVVDREAQRSPDRLEQLLLEADVCLTGGEDHPAVTRRNDAAALAARHRELVVLDIEGYPAGTRHAGRPAVDVLVQARSGLSYEHYSKRPIIMSFAPSHYGAALRGLTGLFAALFRREGTGAGQVVSTSLYEGALVWAAGLWVEVDKPNFSTTFVMPKDPYPLIFRCADGVFVHIVIGASGSKYRMYQALDIDDPTVGPNDSGMPKPTEDPKNFFGDVDLLAAHVAKQPSRQLLERIWALGLPAEPVLAPGACWDMPQIRHNGVIVADPDGTRHVGHPIITTLSEIGAKPPVRAGSRPLDGVRVIDFGAFVAGPFASAVLTDLGADVVKVETPAGDPNRSLFRSYSPANRGKRAITIDLKAPEGLALAKALCASADAVTSNFRSGVSARLGIDPASLHALKPDLVVLESPAYGSTGPLADRAGFDMVMQALCGHEYRGGGVGQEPLWNRTSMVDYAGGFLGAIGVVLALYHRARTGQGVTLDSPLLNAGIFLLSELVQHPDGSFAGGETLNKTRTGYTPAEALYEARDGWIAIAIRDGASAARLAEVLRLGGRLAGNPAEWGEDAAAAIAGAVREQPVEELVAALDRIGVWVEKCQPDPALAMLDDPDLLKAGTTRVSVHPKFGKVREMGGMLRFSRSQLAVDRHAPLHGESTRELLRELGRSDDEIGALMAQKVVA